MAHDVFISYASPDRAVAEAICAALESINIPCWIAPRNVRVGKVWVEAIVDAIDESCIFLLLLSSNSNSSPQVIREVERAASENITIVPIKIDDTPMSKGMGFFISRHQWLNVQIPLRKQDLDGLTQTIQQLLAEDTRSRKRQEAERVAKEKTRQDEEKAREVRESAERARQQAEEVRKAKEAEEKARQEAERLAREKEEQETAERARQQAEQARKTKALEEEARKAKEAEERARKEGERLAKEKEEKEAAEHAHLKAEEARKAREAEEKTRKETGRLVKEKEQQKARKTTERARQQAEHARKEPEKGAQKITKSAWFWASAFFLVISVVNMFVLPIINIDKSALSEEALRAQIGVMLMGVLSVALGVFFLWRSLIKGDISRHAWLRSGDAFFSAGMVLPFVLLFIIIYGANRNTLPSNYNNLPEFTLSVPLLLGASLSFVVPAIFSLRRGLVQDLQPQVIKLTQIGGFWVRLALLLASLVIPIVFAVLISHASDPTEAQSVGLGMTLVICTPLVFLSSYNFWRGLVKNRLSKRNYFWLAGMFLSVGAILPFILMGILLSGAVRAAPRWDLILPPILMVSLPLIVVGVYSLRQGVVKSTLWVSTGLAVMGVIAGGIIAFVSIIGPASLPPSTTPITEPPPTITTPLLPAELVWKISLPFDQNMVASVAIEEWANDIKTNSGGRWQIEIYYSEKLATKDKALDGIKNGLFQGAVISSQYNSDDTPLLTVLQNPFMSPPDINQQWEWLMVVAQYPSIVEELGRWNAQILFPVCSPPYNFMGNIPIRTADDFSGHKINCYNRGALALEKFGAAPYNIPKHLLFSALKEGTVDLAGLPWSVEFAENGLQAVSKYATIDINLIIEDMYLAVNKDAWNELPDEWKQLCQDATAKALATYKKLYAEKDAGFISLCNSSGVEIINFPAAEWAKLVVKAAEVWENWVVEMEKKGLSGQDVLDFAKAKRDEIMSGKTQ